jgi:hypothetical protein
MGSLWLNNELLISIETMNYFIFVVESLPIVCEEGTKFLNVIYMNFMF